MARLSIGSQTTKLTIARLSSPLMAAMLASGLAGSFAIAEGAFAPAIAQERLSVSAEFRAALQPYGRWQYIARWGDVWIPNDRPREWRPYTEGRWAYTDDWGWYWVSDTDEDAWGWIAYHYGRWVFDRDFGWAWVPGDTWGPGFVSWRRGAEHIGWAPLPPDDIEVEFRDRPDVWIFVRSHDFLAPRLISVVLPPRETSVFIRDTVIVNRDVEFRDRGFAVNPGIAPGIVAAAVGRPIRAFDVQPHVLAGTAVRIDNAIQVRANEVARARDSFRQSLRESQHEFSPAARVPPPQALGRNERGRLGEVPPRAVERLGGGEQPGRQGLAPQGGNQGRVGGEQQRGRQNLPSGPNIQRPPATQGLGAPPEQQRQQQNRATQEQQLRQQQQQNRALQEQQLRQQQQQDRATQEQQLRQQDRATQERQQQQNRGAQEEQLRREQNRATQEQQLRQQQQNRGAQEQQLRQQPNRTEGVAPRNPREDLRGNEARPLQRTEPPVQPRAPQQTERLQQQPQPQRAQPPAPQRTPQEAPRTEGRGGGPGIGGGQPGGGGPQQQQQRGRRPGEP
jgi:hypothetical protein